jgi:hypothetical protein
VSITHVLGARILVFVLQAWKFLFWASSFGSLASHARLILRGRCSCQRSNQEEAIYSQDGGVSLEAHAIHPYPGHDPPPPFVEEIRVGPGNERHQPGDFHHAHVTRPQENPSQGLGSFENPNNGHGEGVQDAQQVSIGEQRPLGRDRGDRSRATNIEGRQLLHNPSPRSRADVYVPSSGVESLRAAYERKVSGDTPLEGYQPGAIAFYGDQTDDGKYSEGGSIQEGRPNQFQQNSFQGAHVFEVNLGESLN